MIILGTIMVDDIRMTLKEGVLNGTKILIKENWKL